jgi:hypothetical protein
LQGNKSRDKLLKDIQNVNEHTFMNVAMDVFYYQYEHNYIYKEYVDTLRGPNQVNQLKSPVFLPIEGFKNHKIKSGNWVAENVFESSGTTGKKTSKHYVRNIQLYLNSCEKNWGKFYGNVSEYCFLCLLPGYMDREGSSLIEMMRYFVGISNYESGFYLNNHKELYERLCICKDKKIQTVLFGVSFGLMDFIEKYQLSFPELIIMETGGMKGRREELLKKELHQAIAKAFGVEKIHSEYGMTELFSQAYSKGDGLFYCGDTLKIKITEITDPLTEEKIGKTGLVNIIDLQNIDSCSFIQTQDLGVLHSDKSFELMGRLDYSDIRGCNLMVL